MWAHLQKVHHLLQAQSHQHDLDLVHRWGHAYALAALHPWERALRQHS